MEKSLHDTLDELIKSIKSFAEESYDTGQPMDSAFTLHKQRLF